MNDKVFPPGFRPSFAVVKGYLVLATSPEAILHSHLRAPCVVERANGQSHDSPGGVASYLLTHGPRLAKFLTEMGMVAG